MQTNILISLGFIERLQIEFALFQVGSWGAKQKKKTLGAVAFVIFFGETLKGSLVSNRQPR